MLYYLHGRNYNCKNTFFPRKAVVLRHGLRRLPLKHKNTFKTEKRTSFFKAVQSTEWALSKNQYNIRRTCCRVNRLLITSSTSQDKLCPGARLFFLTIRT